MQQVFQKMQQYEYDAMMKIAIDVNNIVLETSEGIDDREKKREKKRKEKRKRGNILFPLEVY